MKIDIAKNMLKKFRMTNITVKKKNTKIYIIRRNVV